IGHSPFSCERQRPVATGVPAHLRNTTPGFLEIWDGSDGNLLRQYAVPTVDALAPTPVFSYNSLASGAMSPFGTGWVMLYLQSVMIPPPYGGSLSGLGPFRQIKAD
ncbi:MAG TPA: hypothetical protein VND64_16595, partial [Pirellulales bacterium]|nr:hypothetical protein [Pirellulales bacterium]